MRLAVLTAVVVLSLSATGSFAQNASIPPALPGNTIYSTQAPAEVTNPPRGDDTMVCDYQTEIGTLFITKVCRTLRAWKLMQADAKEFMGFGFRGAHQCGEGGCGHGNGHGI